MIVQDHAALNQEAARRIAALIEENNDADRNSSLILPVGPLLYEPLADLCNERRARLDRLTIFMMDEYLQPDGAAIPESHPLSFRAFMRKSLVSRLDPALGFSTDRLIFPLPDVMDKYSERILSMGGVDICFGGVGISGHLAFNDPPEPHETDKGVDWVRNCRTRVVTISRESNTQMAVGGTHGNWAIIPHQAVTVGMKEIMASKKIILTFMRSWHSGTMRRSLFGPISADCPASVIQKHPNVEVILTELAAQPPLVNVTLDTGEEESE
jgi:glucosamine-6-phosphate deaminase